MGIYSQYCQLYVFSHKKKNMQVQCIISKNSLPKSKMQKNCEVLTCLKQGKNQNSTNLESAKFIIAEMQRPQILPKSKFDPF